MTDSPLAFARAAVDGARAALPAYTSRYSRKDFAQHRLVALLAVKQFLGVGYRGLVAYLADWAELREALGLTKVPHFATAQKAPSRLEQKAPTPR
jgi:hypothetical protein